MKITRPLAGPRMMAGALFLSLPMLLPIEAHAAVGDPAACGNLSAVTLGSVTAGQLIATTDCPTGTGEQTRLTDRYKLTLTSPAVVTLGLTSADYQPLVGLRKAASTDAGFGPLLGSRAISTTGLVNPQFVLPSGAYAPFATTRLSHVDTPPSGAYSLSVEAAIEPQVGCVPTRGATNVTFGSTAEAAISNADCTLPAREGVVAGDTPRYMDQYMMLMTGGQIAHMQVETDFDYRIEHWIIKNGTSVMDGALPLVKANQEKLLTISDSVDATHTVILVAINPGETGGYSLDFSDYKQNQRDSLISFYNSTNGANWTNKTNWLSEAGTECTWYGVTCEDGMVRTLNLDGNGLTGTIPSQLRMLSDLSILSLANNQLTGSIPAELGTLELSGLFLQNNQLSGAVPSALLTMSTLTASNYTGNTQLTQPLLDSGERTALLAFYNATGGDNWTNKTGWGGAVGTECSWYGITCIGGYVTAINFPTTLVASVPVGNGLVGTLPAALSGLPKLRSLSLVGNQLSGTIPAEVWNLTELRTLSLALNQLTGTLPSVIGNLTKLVNLLLYNNALTGPIPVEVGTLSTLTSLQLFSNQFSGTIPAQLGNLTQMLNLNLRGNQLTGAIPPELGKLTKMLFLSLGGNQLTGPVPTELGSLTSLSYLHLQDNQLTGQIPAELGNLVKLITLNMPGNQLSGSIPPQIGNIATLTTISLQNNQLSGAIPASFATLPALTSIDVTGNKLDRNALVAFYNATGGDNWTNKTNWLGAPGTECTWYGVGCTNGVVTSLNFPANFSATPPTGNNLVGTLPVELAMLTELRNLYLGVNQLSGTIPAELGTLSKLQTLSVFDNQLSGTIPAALGNLKELTLLGLASNNLTGTIPVELASLPKLQTLRLFDNQLTGSIPPELANLSQLQILEIQNNQLSGTVPQALAALASLTTFNYTGNKIIPFLVDTNERTALMAFFNATGGDNWTNKTGWGGPVGTECSWYGVGCNNGHVTTLNFPTTTVAGVRIGNNLSGALPPEIGNLAELWQISLDANELSGAIPVTIGNLKKLTTIAMGHNNLSGEIPVEIGSLSALKQLYLYDNQLTGAIPAALGNLLNLEQLYLNINQLTGTIPAALGNLKKLQNLNLYTNQLTGTIPTEIWQLTALKELSLERNQLSGSLPTELGNLVQLTHLRLFDNLFNGPLPASIGNLTKLTTLILSNNDFTGEIPASIGQLTELTHLSLPSNQLTGSIPGELANLTKLTSLYLNHNQLTGVTPAWISTLPLLVNLNLDGNLIIPALANPAERDALLAFYTATSGDNWTNKTGWGGAVGTECSWYGVRCSSGHVTAIDFPTAVVSGVVRGNGLVGTLPAEITTLTHLVTLKLNNNQLSGTIPAGLWDLTSLTDLQLATNQLTGQIPPAIGNLVNLRFLLLNGNQFSGPLPGEIANLTKLVNLTLTNFPIAGPFPEWIEGLKELTSLGLSGTQLTGAIPEWMGSLTKLTNLQLSGNQLTGAIPPSVGNLVNLISLNLGNNQLSGEIPAEIANLKKLTSLLLFTNQLSGPIPAGIGTLGNLTSLVLSSNQLSGEIPSSLGNLAKLTTLFLSSNQLSGPIPGELANLANLQTLSLFNNQLSGTIPAWLDSSTKLTSLNLGDNLLSGAVPTGIYDLPLLTSLNLFGNTLDGLRVGDIAACENLTSAGLGEVVTGVLDRAADCFLPATQRLTDRYLLALGEQTAVTLTTTATEFQAQTGVAAASSPYAVIGSRSAQDESSATAQFLLPAGSWRLFSSTQESNPNDPPAGSYSLTVTGNTEPQLGCMPSTFVVKGSVPRGTLASGDCVGKPLPGETEGQVTRYMDSYAISLSAGDIARVALTADIDVTFEWWTNDVAPFARSPLTPAGQQAVFEVTANSAATHTLVVLAANHQAVGAYTMTFSQGTPPPEPEPEPEPEPTPVPVPDTGTGGGGTEGSGTGGSGTGGTGTGGTGTGGTPPEETPITQEELTESITNIEGALDAIEVVPGTAPSEEILTQVSNALDQADTLAQQLITALPEGTAGVTAALDALEVMNNTLSVTGEVTQEGGVVSQESVVNSLGNVADLLTTLSSRSDVITTEQQEAVQTLATAAVENSANLIVSTTTAEELVQLVSAVSDVINAAAQAGGILTAELVDQAEALTSKAISTGLNQFSEGIDVTDSAAVANVLRSNPDALQFALEASVVLQSSSSGDSAAVESELAALGLSEEDSERLSANVLGSVANPDGVSVGGVSATDALINALSQLLSGATAQGLSQSAVAGLVVQALSDTDAKVQVNAATGVMTISLPGQKFYGAAVNIRLVPASVPAGISYMRDGRGVLVANGLAIELAPVSANVLAFASAVQKQGFAMTMRNNGAFSLNLGSGQRFSGTFAYDNLQAMAGTCAGPEFVTPQGAANDPGYVFGVRCEAGVEQRIAPFMEDPAFYQTASSGGLNVSTDRNTGIISITSVGRFKPSFFVSEPTEADKTWLAANKNANGVALRAVEANGDGIADFEFVSASGVQLLLGVRP